MKKITRISFNSKNWQRPTGEAAKLEGEETHNHKFGFGHEDWLFRADWLIDGWRYGFIQGVNKSHKTLVDEMQPFDLTLFTIDPEQRRRYVASIQSVECLENRQASDALEVFKKRGWYDAMVQEIEAVQGDIRAIGETNEAKHVLNIRYRLTNLSFYPPDSYADANDPIRYFTRYQLYEDAKSASAKPDPQGSPNLQNFMRRPVPSIECTPEHARIQEKLIDELKSEFPNARIKREDDCMDVTVRTDQELIIFEIKSDLDATSVIRLALGQILEYAFHPTRQHKLRLRLVIVGRCRLSALDRAYLEHLIRAFCLPIEYRFVDMTT